MASDKAVTAFGSNYVFHKVAYSGAATTFSVDQTATVAATVDPASGPTASVAQSGSVDGLSTVTLAAGGADNGGSVVVVTTHGKSIASSKFVA